MPQSLEYNGSLTAEQFLFREIRITSRMYLDGIDVNKAIELVLADNLFQYPTERQVSRMVRACYKRIEALDNQDLVQILATGDIDTAKQVNLYAMMRYNMLVRDFMIRLVGEKLRIQDYFLTKKDISAFFTDLQAQNNTVASWSEETIKRIRGVLVRCLVETQYLENQRDEKLHPVFLSEDLERGIRDNGDESALVAFNCFE